MGLQNWYFIQEAELKDMRRNMEETTRQLKVSYDPPNKPLLIGGVYACRRETGVLKSCRQRCRPNEDLRRQLGVSECQHVGRLSTTILAGEPC